MWVCFTQCVCFTLSLFHSCDQGVTPVDGSPSQAYSDCYPVVLDGAVVGWIETELAPILVESLRTFKV